MKFYVERVARLRLTAVTVILMVCGALMCACSKPEYWVKGLTLPPGSTVVSRTEDVPPTAQTKSWGSNLPKGMLFVRFNNPNSWPAVSGHFDKLMLSSGYSLEVVPPAEQTTSSGLALNRQEALHTYSKPGSCYRVSILNNEQYIALVQSVSQSAGLDPLPAVPSKRGDYTLDVSWWKR